jgi:hypothetical protein
VRKTVCYFLALLKDGIGEKFGGQIKKQYLVQKIRFSQANNIVRKIKVDEMYDRYGEKW